MKTEFRENHKNGVLFYTSDKIKAKHAFTTRKGGVSTIPYLSSMNLSKTVGDDPDKVDENFNIISEAVGFDKNDIVFTSQLHSNIVRTVTKKDCNQTFDCDGFVTDTKGVVLSVRSADCIPILLYDEEARIIGAVHAGWRGTVGGIQQNGIFEMTALGASPERIKVAIGAAIHRCCFEVGEDFISALNRELGEKMTERHTEIIGGKPHFDLISLNVELLTQVGVKEENIDISPDCTCCKSDIYFSHRASNGKRGVLSAFITL